MLPFGWSRAWLVHSIGVVAAVFVACGEGNDSTPGGGQAGESASGRGGSAAAAGSGDRPSAAGSGGREGLMGGAGPLGGSVARGEGGGPSAGAGGAIGGANIAAAGGRANLAGEAGVADAGAGGAESDPDENQDHVADDLGKLVDLNHDFLADTIDINRDGKPDGPGIDTDGDGAVDALALDPDCDGFYEAADTDGDGKPNLFSRLKPVGNTPGCTLPALSRTSGGGSGATGGASVAD